MQSECLLCIHFSNREAMEINYVLFLKVFKLSIPLNVNEECFKIYRNFQKQIPLKSVFQAQSYDIGLTLQSWKTLKVVIKEVFSKKERIRRTKFDLGLFSEIFRKINEITGEHDSLFEESRLSFLNKGGDQQCL